MAFLTEDQQKELARFLRFIDEKNSNVGFVNQAIDDIREKNRAGGTYAAVDHPHDDGLTDEQFSAAIVAHAKRVDAAMATHSANPDAHHA